MDIELAERARRVKPSPTLAVTARAKALRAAGQDIIGLGAGEPDFDTPETIKEAAIAAIRAGDTKYTAVDGTPALKEAVAAKFRRDNNLDYDLDQILVSAGGKQSFFNLCQALLNPGDEVVIPAPYWVSYPDIVRLAEGEARFVETSLDAGFKMTPDQLEAAITDRTRLVIINSPSNPTGVAYSREELAALGAVLERHPGVLVATDDIYEHIRWEAGAFINIVNAAPALKDRAVVLNGVSKAYSMTGWRIGYAAGPADLIAAMKTIQSQSTSNPASISQAAAVEALTGDQSCIETMVTAFKQRHDFVVDALGQLPGVRPLPGQGAFYCFPDMSEAIQRLGLADDVAFAEHLLTEAGVALVPGSAFGAPGCMRLSFATSLSNLEQAMERLAGVLGKG
ncbi:aspartate aminotransferase [Thiohalospira halophila DSM 15071]|uniref:Aminotransferase n=1 Tax=Thiohalospira halophila DSM 15071 TaxID=1123397 RepID=A0A1I1PDV3_9GAMM|nr:pyridoxal phosphate-dependent aminotransferase [Thiohalospira halophila]SFD07935.1 aspartate aminotransferase [Thiohalospira halophila DSM 15071]